MSQRLSHFLYITLKPLCPVVNSFIKDDFDVLSRIPKTVTNGSKLAPFYIVDLYTNIPHDLGIKAVKYWLNKSPDYVDGRLSEEFIINALKLF